MECIFSGIFSYTDIRVQTRMHHDKRVVCPNLEEGQLKTSNRYHVNVKLEFDSGRLK